LGFGPGGLNTWSRRAFAQGRQGAALAPAEVALWLRLATIVAALGCAFLLDDPSESTTEGVAGSQSDGSPTTRTVPPNTKDASAGLAEPRTGHPTGRCDPSRRWGHVTGRRGL
jgi:hypothetical protein